MIGLAVLIIGILIVAIWVLIELKRMRHKIFAIFLILLIIFLYISITYSLKGQDVNLNTTEGVMKGAKIYFAWLASAFNNVKAITSNAINMDWAYKNQSGKK